MARKPLASEQYVAKKGTVCPNCRSKDVGTIDNLDPDGDEAYQNCKCNDCGALWVDRYTLHSYDNLEIPF